MWPKWPLGMILPWASTYEAIPYLAAAWNWKSQCPCAGSSSMACHRGQALPTLASETVPAFELLDLAED